MIKKLVPFFSVLVLITLIFSVVQYFAVQFIIKGGATFFFSTWSIYLFHFVATFLVFFFILFVNQTFSEKTGFVFMACSLLKMMAAVIFFIPLIQNGEGSLLNDVLAFFIPYFIFLFLETFYVLKIINKP